jgi:hypothetical protein
MNVFIFILFITLPQCTSTPEPENNYEWPDTFIIDLDDPGILIPCYYLETNV